MFTSLFEVVATRRYHRCSYISNVLKRKSNNFLNPRRRIGNLVCLAPTLNFAMNATILLFC